MNKNAAITTCLATCTMLNFGVTAFSFAIHHAARAESFLAVTSETKSGPGRHIVNGVECVEVPIELPSLGGRVVVLEATAESQEDLVNLALEEEGDETDTIHSSKLEKLNAGDPYGAVLWPAAYAIAERVLSDPAYKSNLYNQTVLELGAGTGLVSLALSLAGTKQVIASDYETIPLALLEYAAINLNPMEEPQEHSISYQLLDMRDYDSKLPPADLVVAADIMYEPKTGVAMAQRAVEALKRGSGVLVGDSPGRPGRQAFLDELKRLGVTNAAFVDTIGYTVSGPRHELICGKNSTSVSDTPQEMKVAVMELDPHVHLPKR